MTTQVSAVEYDGLGMVYTINDQNPVKFSLGTVLNQGALPILMRKTLAQLGGRVGSRQPDGFMNG